MPAKELPSPNKRSWRLNTTKASRLSFSELMQLDQHQKADTHYSELPAWIIEGGYVTPTQQEKLRQSQLERDTGYNAVERAEIFSAFNADLGAIAAMTEKESLRGSIFLDQYLEKAFNRFGEAEVMDALKEDYPKAAEHVVAHIKVKRAEAAAAEAMLQEQANEADVRAEIKATQEAIEIMQETE